MSTQVGTESPLDPLLLAVMSSRFESIVREMSDVLLRSARSAIINTARDLSCSILTAGGEVVATGEGLPIHILGGRFSAAALLELHPDLREGDAFLINDPYLGSLHAADYTILVPVFHDGEHVFTACAVAHQADCGNATPTAYASSARDVYEEGALIFPCVKIQSGFRDVDDIIRMARVRIRVPDQWYGDYLATVGAARIGERRLRELVDKHSLATVRQFVDEWFSYSESCIDEAIRAMPPADVVARTFHDALPEIPDGVPIAVHLTIVPEEGRIRIDLRDNPDNLPCGLNMTLATAHSASVIGAVNSLPHPVPVNAGSLRRISVELREGCALGIPRHPASCSVATTNLTDRVINLIQSTLAELHDDLGLAQGAVGMPPNAAVISGFDRRRGNAYINQLTLGVRGGPASPTEDGWVGYDLPVIAGLMYRDSVEVDELKHAMIVEEQRLLPDTEGAGRMRGAPGSRVVYRPVDDEMTVVYHMDGHTTPPQGVRGGGAALPCAALKRRTDGAEVPLPPAGTVTLAPGEAIIAVTSGGGGYGDPLERDPQRVLRDVRERWITPERAAEIYGVVLVEADGRSAIDERATAARRAQHGRSRGLSGARDAA